MTECPPQEPDGPPFKAQAADATIPVRMNCSVCSRPLFEGASACIVCGAPVRDLPPGYGVPYHDAYAPGPRVDAPAPLPLFRAPETAPLMYARPYPPAAIPQNHVAVVSFVCGLLGLVPLWLGFVLCIVAIVCGIVGIQQSVSLPGERGKGLAIAGLVLGLVFIIPAGCGL